MRHRLSRLYRQTCARVHAWHLSHDDAGQATTEYALVMLGAALVALLVVSWATSGGGAGKVGRLFDRIMDRIISQAG
jgi:hypothetical protein